MAERAMSQGYVPTDIEAKGGEKRRRSTVDHRGSVVDPNAQMLDHAELSAADRRLAEMGYVQVSSHRTASQNVPPVDCATSLRYTNENSHGCPASPSLWPFQVCTPAFPPPSYTHWRLEARLLRYGAGLSQALAATALRFPSPSSSLLILPAAGSTSHANTSRL